MQSSTHRLVAYGCLALSMALVGSYVALSKPLVAVFPVMLLAWLRFAIGAVAMAHWLRRPPSEPPLDARARWLLFLESFLGNFLFSVCMLFGVSMTSAVSAGVIMATIPATVAIMSWALLRERIEGRTWLAVGCAVVGIALLRLAQPGGGAATAPTAGPAWLGNALVFGAVVCEAAYAVIGKVLAGRIGPRRITALINLWGLALVTPFGAHAAMRFDYTAVPASLWLLLLFYGLAASVWSVWLWMTGLRHVPAARAGVFTVMLPVSTAAVGVLVLGEPWGLLQLCALGFALAGVLMATLPAPDRRSPFHRSTRG